MVIETKPDNQILHLVTQKMKKYILSRHMSIRDRLRGK